MKMKAIRVRMNLILRNIMGYPLYERHYHYYSFADSKVLFLLLMITASLFSTVGGKFGTVPLPSASTSSGSVRTSDQQLHHQYQQQQLQQGQHHNSLSVLDLSGPQPSDKFIPCHFNLGCFCKYDQKTEIYDSLRRLWQLVGFNESSFFRAVNALQREIRNDPTTTYFFTESEFSQLAQMVVNSSSSTVHTFSTYPASHHYAARSMEPGPIFEFVCLAVRMSVIPTGKSTKMHTSIY